MLPQNYAFILKPARKSGEKFQKKGGCNSFPPDGRTAKLICLHQVLVILCITTPITSAIALLAVMIIMTTKTTKLLKELRANRPQGNKQNKVFYKAFAPSGVPAI